MKNNNQIWVIFLKNELNCWIIKEWHQSSSSSQSFQDHAGHSYLITATLKMIKMEMENINYLEPKTYTFLHVTFQEN